FPVAALVRLREPRGEGRPEHLPSPRMGRPARRAAAGDQVAVRLDRGAAALGGGGRDPRAEDRTAATRAAATAEPRASGPEPASGPVIHRERVDQTGATVHRERSRTVNVVERRALEIR